MIKSIFILVLFILSFSTRGQNNFGSLHSNFTPTNSVYINPSSILDAKVWLDINIVGAGSYTNNNLVYLNDQRWSTVLKDLINDESRLTEDDVLFDQGQFRYHSYNRNFITGPSGVWSQGDHAAALSTGVRSYTGVRKIPDYAAYFIEYGVPPYTEQHDIDYDASKIKLASLHFGEIKGSYAYTFLKRRRDMLMGGISISKFFSLAGGALNVYDASFNVDNDSLAILYHLEADAMYTPEVKFNAKGGFGIDIGFTYQKMLGNASSYYPNSSKMGCERLNYLYKLGISIMDIGSVKYDEDDILFSGYNFDDYLWLNYDEAEVDEDNATTVLAEAESQITEGQVRKKNKINLPTFLSVQFDYNLWNSKVYVNVTAVQGIPPFKRQFGLRHANSLSITPRFESYFFDFALPISLYEYYSPQLGASIRLGPITIGSDKLLSWLTTTDLYGMDIYAHLKLPIQYNPKCKSRLKGSKKSRSRLDSPTRCTY